MLGLLNLQICIFLCSQAGHSVVPIENRFTLRNELWMFKANTTVGSLQWVKEQRTLQMKGTDCSD